MKKTAIQKPEGLTEVLLHACCAPCSSAIVEWLLNHDIQPVIYYYNPNIYPFEEYEKRRDESRHHAETLGVSWLEGPYNHDEWLFSVKGLEREPERGKRCSECFFHRLFATARKAQELDIPFFATTLASSRWKNLEQVNAAGMAAELKAKGERLEANEPSPITVSHSPLFWAQNWRKDGLQDRRNELLKQFEFYNQTYCGCEFSTARNMGSIEGASPTA